MNFLPSFLCKKQQPTPKPAKPTPKAGKYDYALLDLLGTDILRHAIQESNIAVADAQRLCKESREKGMQSAYWGITIAIGLLTVIVSTVRWKVRLLLAPLFIIMLIFLYRVGAHIIYRKENYTGGSTEKYMFDQKSIDYLQQVDEEHKLNVFLSIRLMGKEDAANSINAETERMQTAYEKAAKFLYRDIIIYSILASIFFIWSLVEHLCFQA